MECRQITPQIIAEYMFHHPNLKLLNNTGCIVPTGLNAALRYDCGDIIVRVDGHTCIEPDYVSQCVHALRESGAENVGGKMTAIGEGLLGQAVAVATSTSFGSVEPDSIILTKKNG